MKTRPFVLAGLFIVALASAGCGAKSSGPSAASRPPDGGSRDSVQRAGDGLDRATDGGAAGREELSTESGESPRLAALPKDSGAGWIPPSALPPPTHFPPEEPVTAAAEPPEQAGESGATIPPPEDQVPHAPSNTNPEKSIPRRSLLDLPLPGFSPPSQDVGQNAAEPATEGGNPLRSAEPRIRPATRPNPLRMGISSFAPRLPASTAGNPPRIPTIPPATTAEDAGQTPRDGSSSDEPAPPSNYEPSGGSAQPLIPPRASDYGLPPPPPLPLPAASAFRPPAEFVPELGAGTPIDPAVSVPESGPADETPPEDSPPAETSPEMESSVESTGESSPPVDVAPRKMMTLMGSGNSSEPPTAASPPTPSTTPHIEGPFTVVKVFYGTDRLAVAAGQPSPGFRFITWFPLFLTVTLAITLVVSAIVYRWSQRVWVGIVAAVVVGALCVGLGRPFSSWSSPVVAVGNGPITYGNGRGELQYGACEITIPKLHEVGEIERPSIWRLDVQERSDRHIIVRSVERQEEQAFYDAVKQRVSSSPRKDLFVFIHGYNVSFETAARRTAQMAHDLNFAGAPIFYSWPSQGGLLQYPVDENNVAWTVPHLKQFLRDVVARSDAQAINVIAHSMGNRALAAAVRELTLENQPTAKQFNEVVLAAPDIDAEVFKRDIAPMLAQNANHVTLYASSRDQALVASKLVHGYPRAGDSGSNLVVMPGLETVDVTEVDTGILGHSYYGNSVPILRDLALLFGESASAARRPWLEPAERDGQKYWVFDEKATAARAPGSRR